MKIQIGTKELKPETILYAVLFIFFLLHLYQISAPPNGYHQWRESDTAAVSLNFYQEDMNFLHPRVNQRGSHSGITGSELPIYNYTAALAYQIFGPSHTVHRLITLVAALFAIWFFFKIILCMTRDKNIALFSAFALAFSPLFFFYSFKIMPDIWMLSFLLGSIYFYLKFLESKKISAIVFSAITLILSATLKPLSLSIYLVYHVLGLKSKLTKSKTYTTLAFFIVLTFLPTLSWYLYARHINEINQTPGFYLGNLLDTFYTYLTLPDFYKMLFLQWPFDLWIGWPLVIFFVTGIYILIKNKLKYGFFIWTFACYAVFVLVSSHSYSHDYYTLIIVPPLAAITGVGINHITQMKKYGKAILILLLLLIPFTPFLRIHQRFIDVPNFDKIRSDAAEVIPSKSLVMVEDATTAIRLYQLNKTGWPLRGTITYSHVKQLVNEGGNIIVLENEIGKYDDSLKYLFERKYKKIDNLFCYLVKK